uniref:Photosystem II 10 kDa polypeptide, chloroplastic n=2 Tax=Lotharella globosa TaxID=91324 RepID=A0A6V3K9P0_9EUKA|mmetsp:Transcript_27201/g.52748  ORF Transcript_27201/g.52748 Transcript_27201/m.52748 type:complete len:178 (-) Transcript_27201:262-795(-)
MSYTDIEVFQAPKKRSTVSRDIGIGLVAGACIALVGLAAVCAAPNTLGAGITSMKIRSAPSRVVAHMKVTKVDISKKGLNSIDDPTIQANLQGRSRAMEDKNWVDPQGRKGKGYGVYKFAKKYGANVDGYSPIYTPDIWAESGNSYKLGTNALIAWLVLVVVLLAIGANLIISTSQL